MFISDFVLNGQAHGAVAGVLEGVRYDPGLMRPYLDENNVPCCTVNSGRSEYNAERNEYIPVFEKVPLTELMGRGMANPVWNATLLRKDEWLMIDRAVVKAARSRLRAWDDLAAANTFGGFNGMAKMILEYEAMSDPGEAIEDMDGLSEGRSDAPKFQLRGLPLPITHSGFWYSQRKLAVSRNTGTPVDTTMAEAAARRVAERIEQVTIGAATGMTYGNYSSLGYDHASRVYGYTNYTNRVTKTNMATPDGTNGSTVLTSWLQLRDALYNVNHYGPFMAYTSTDYDTYLDNLFSTTEPSAGTLRSRLLQIDGIQGIRRLDYLTDTFTVLLVEMVPEVARAVVGMPLTTLQWESSGGMRVDFKVMTIMVPQLRSDFSGNCGIAHGTTS